MKAEILLFHPPNVPSQITNEIKKNYILVVIVVYRFFGNKLVPLARRLNIHRKKTTDRYKANRLPSIQISFHLSQLSCQHQKLTYFSNDYSLFFIAFYSKLIHFITSITSCLARFSLCVCAITCRFFSLPLGMSVHACPACMCVYVCKHNMDNLNRMDVDVGWEGLPKSERIGKSVSASVRYYRSDRRRGTATHKPWQMLLGSIHWDAANWLAGSS